MLKMYKDDKEVEDASFIYNEKTINININNIYYDNNNESNNKYIKVCLIDWDDDRESVWALVSSENYDKYNSNSEDYITVVLANNTLAGLEWGTVFPVKLLGNKMPIFDMRLVDSNQSMYIAKSLV